MKKKLVAIFDYLLFLLFFIFVLPSFMITGAILRPIRYYKNVSDKIHNKKVKEYYY